MEDLIEREIWKIKKRVPSRFGNTLFHNRYWKKFLPRLLEEAPRTGRKVKPGPISNIDREYYHIEPYAHDNCKDLIEAIGYEHIRPLAEALRQRGINTIDGVKRGSENETPGLSKISDLDQFCQGYHETRIHPLKFKQKYINHDASISGPGAYWELDDPDLPKEDREDIAYTFERSITEIERFIRAIGLQGAVGDPNVDAATYLKTYEFDHSEEKFEDGMCGEGGDLITIRFQIDTDKLTQLRDVYADPECIASSSCPSAEYKNCFMVFGGIPLEAVVDYQIWYPNHDYSQPPQVKEV